jgi:hypothetical protein
MMLFFLPPAIQALIGAAVIAAGLFVHNVPVLVVGVLGLAVGGVRWVARKRNGGARA